MSDSKHIIVKQIPSKLVRNAQRHTYMVDSGYDTVRSEVIDAVELLLESGCSVAFDGKNIKGAELNAEEYRAWLCR